ncbi:MAG: DUF4032 domain-containing protein [Myxococcota bacterium]|jgi:hypothetical protein|nr:DUF4032 domain-containing protein [Myxococcota bacterium]
MSDPGHRIHVRPGFPDFLELPWARPLTEWPGVCDRLVEVERGLSRHEVLFVEQGASGIFAIKELPDPRLAAAEYELLRRLQAKGLPAVEAVGHVELLPSPTAAPRSLLLTRFLDLSLPYRSLFVTQGMARYQERLLSAMACLLVRLHLAGCFWGDCSLSNVLFKRDAGQLGAYLVDAETSALHEGLGESLRLHDLDIMEENVYGDLVDLTAEHPGLAARLQPEEIVRRIREQYDGLWQEIRREVVVDKHERYRIHERIEALNQLGFSVDEVELVELGDQGKLRIRTLVTDQSYHRHHLHNLTGIVAKDHESRLMLNEIRELKATLSRRINRSTPLSSAAFTWMRETYLPSLARLRAATPDLTDEPGVYCQLLEHKWYLSEKAGHDVGLEAAITDFLTGYLLASSEAAAAAALPAEPTPDPDPW